MQRPNPFLWYLYRYRSLHQDYGHHDLAVLSPGNEKTIQPAKRARLNRDLLSSAEKWAAVKRLSGSDYTLKRIDFAVFNGNRMGAVSKDVYDPGSAGNESAIDGIESAEYITRKQGTFFFPDTVGPFSAEPAQGEKSFITSGVQ